MATTSRIGCEVRGIQMPSVLLHHWRWSCWPRLSSFMARIHNVRSRPDCGWVFGICGVQEHDDSFENIPYCCLQHGSHPSKTHCPRRTRLSNGLGGFALSRADPSAITSRRNDYYALQPRKRSYRTRRSSRSNNIRFTDAWRYPKDKWERHLSWSQNRR